MTMSSGPTSLGGSGTGRLVNQFEALAKQQALEAGSLKKKVKPEGELRPQQPISMGPTTTYTSVPEETGKKKSSEVGMLEQVGRKPMEKGSESSKNVGKEVMTKALKMKKIKQPSSEVHGRGGTTETSTTSGVTQTPTRTTANTTALFAELKKEFPHLEGHFDTLRKQGVEVELVTNDNRAATGAYFYSPKKDEPGPPAIRVNNDPPISHTALKDNILFESFNAWSDTEYKKLDNDLRLRKLTPAEYGVAKARVESQVSIKHVDSVLNRFQGEDRATARGKLSWLAKQVPEDLSQSGARDLQNQLNREAASLGLDEKALRALAWAERQSPGYITRLDPAKHGAMEEAFVKAPHDKTAPKTHRASLSSGDLYCYEGIERQTAGGLIGILQAPLKGLDFNEANAIRKKVGELRGRLEGFDKNPLPENATSAEKNRRAGEKLGEYHQGLQGLLRDIGDAKGSLNETLRSLKEQLKRYPGERDPMHGELKERIVGAEKNLAGLTNAEAATKNLQLSEGIKRFAGIQG
jgi:hypothetical protein